MTKPKNARKESQSRLREDFGSHLNLFSNEVDLCRDAFERYLEFCEAEITAGRKHPFFVNKLNMERLLDQLNGNDPLMAEYTRPDPVERDAKIAAMNEWSEASDVAPLFSTDDIENAGADAPDDADG